MRIQPAVARGTMAAPDQPVRVAGNLDTLRHRDRMFTLILRSGARVRGVVADGSVALSALRELCGHDVVMSGVAKFRPSGSVLRVEAEWIERANERDLSLWASGPGPIPYSLDERALHRPQRLRSGVGAIFGQLAYIESDDDIIEALDRFS